MVCSKCVSLIQLSFKLYIHQLILFVISLFVHQTSDHIVDQQANRYIVAFHIAISRYRTIRSGLLITGGL